MTPTILVTGATGMIGSRLCQALVRRGVPFKAMVRPGGSGEQRLSGLEGVHVVTGDFDDPDSLAAALQGVDRAFLLTNSTERTESQQLAFVSAARGAGVQHLVKLSQLAAHAESPVRFLRYHAAVEAAVVDSGMAWTFLRPNLVLQAYLPFAAQVADGVLQAPVGPAAVSVVDARDIAAVAATVLTGDAGGGAHTGATYDLTGPVAVTHQQIATAFGAAAGHDVRFESVPPDAFSTFLQSVGMPEWQAQGLIEDYQHYTRGEAAAVSADILDVTGTPPRSVDDFARDNVDAFRRP